MNRRDFIKGSALAAASLALPAFATEAPSSGFLCGIPQVDGLLGGFRRGKMVVFSGQTGGYKTQLAYAIASGTGGYFVSENEKRKGMRMVVGQPRHFAAGICPVSSIEDAIEHLKVIPVGQTAVVDCFGLPATTTARFALSAMRQVAAERSLALVVTVPRSRVRNHDLRKYVDMGMSAEPCFIGHSMAHLYGPMALADVFVRMDVKRDRHNHVRLQVIKHRYMSIPTGLKDGRWESEIEFGEIALTTPVFRPISELVLSRNIPTKEMS